MNALNYFFDVATFERKSSEHSQIHDYSNIPEGTVNIIDLDQNLRGWKINCSIPVFNYFRMVKGEMSPVIDQFHWDLAIWLLLDKDIVQFQVSMGNNFFEFNNTFEDLPKNCLESINWIFFHLYIFNQELRKRLSLAFFYDVVIMSFVVPARLNFGQWRMFKILKDLFVNLIIDLDPIILL